MDLIYRDENGVDIGVVESYSFDLAYGSSENNFELEMPLDLHCMKYGYTLYVEGTEYGGIITGIAVDTEKQIVTYTGETWHGILASKILCPDAGDDYLFADGEANSVIATLLARSGIDGLFKASTDISPIEIIQYQFERYTDLYSGLCKMLSANNGKLKVVFKDGFVNLSAEYSMNYAADDEWDSSQLDLKLGTSYNTVNHMVCLGSGDLAERHVIHLFTDQNGGVQDYYSATCPRLEDGTPMPTNDTHYNLGVDKQVLFGVDEIAEVYDYGGAGTAENYVLLNSAPADWKSNYRAYYQRSDEKFESIPENIVETYTVQTAKPSNWATKYGTYYAKSGSSYAQVQGTSVDVYKAIKVGVKPSNWTKSYSSYYTSDGVNYSAVSGKSKDKYTLQTIRPSDWNVLNPEKTAYGCQNYFKKNKDGSFTNVTLNPGYKVPTWAKNKYYTKGSITVAPDFNAKTVYYTKTTATTAPNWAANTYYTYSKYEAAPGFVANTYYEMQLDNFADLISNALERLSEYWDCDSISVDMDENDIVYDIGDMVGATEEVTGLSVTQPITKKIVNLNNNIVTIEYEIGGN